MINALNDKFMHKADVDIIESKHVLELLSISQEYIRFMSECENYEKKIIINYLQKIFPLMYLKGSLIPKITPSNENADERYVSEEEYEQMYLKLNKIFNLPCQTDFNCDCTKNADKIAEELTDIYQDLKDFVLLYNKKLLSSQECAVHNVRIWFIQRWGIHISNLLVTFHTFLYELNHPKDCSDA